MCSGLPVRYTSRARFVLDFYTSRNSPRHNLYAKFQATIKEAIAYNQVNLVSAYKSTNLPTHITAPVASAHVWEEAPEADNIFI